jgi:hypothetical protein
MQSGNLTVTAGVSTTVPALSFIGCR